MQPSCYLVGHNRPRIDRRLQPAAVTLTLCNRRPGLVTAGARPLGKARRAWGPPDSKARLDRSGRVHAPVYKLTYV